jgi:hypothetical protein
MTFAKAGSLQSALNGKSQNKRHIMVLKSLLQDYKILPKRLGFSIPPHFLPYVLVSPTSRVIRPKAKDFNTDAVIKSDDFYKKTRDNLNNESIFATMCSMVKIVSCDSLKEVAEKLASYHRPAQVDYYKKFSISKMEVVEATSPTSNEQEERSRYYCYSCRKSISKNVAYFCFNRKIRFSGRAYCLDCQKQFPLN